MRSRGIRCAVARPTRSGLLVLSLCIGLTLGISQCSAQSDWCSAVVVRPDQRYVDPAHCVPVWTDAAIASSADVVMIGDFTDVAYPVIPAPGRECYPSPSHAANASYVNRLRAARAAIGGQPLEIVHMSRFELVPAVLAATPGFDSNYLLRTVTSWSSVTGFFTNDRSSACPPTGCRWSDSWGGKDGTDTGNRLRDYIDASAGPGRFASTVQYLAGPDGTQVYWPSSAIADLNDRVYRLWRVVEAQQALAIGGYDAIDLNQKFHQFLYWQHWIGGDAVKTVQDLEDSGDTYWTAAPYQYAYADYVAGWYALAADLKHNGVPFSVTLPVNLWYNDNRDDPSTPTVNEAAMVREVATWAKLVLVDRPTVLAPSIWTPIVNQIIGSGARVVPFDQACPLVGQ